MEFWKLILKENGVSEIRVLKIKLRNWSFENYLKIGILDNYLKIEVLESKFRNWKFGKLNFDIKMWRIKKNDEMWFSSGAWEGGHAWPCGSGLGVQSGYLVGGELTRHRSY